MHLLLCLLAASAQISVDSRSTVTVDPASFSITLSMDEPEWRSIDGLWYPHFDGMVPDLLEGVPVMPSRTFYVPVPPGSTPTLSCTETGSGRTQPPGDILTGPVVQGTGLNTRWVPSALREVLPERGYGEVRIIRVAGTTVAAVTLYPMLPSDPGRYATGLTATLSWEERSGYRPVDRYLLETLCVPGAVYWPETQDREPSPFWGVPWARLSIGPGGMYAVTGRDLEDAGCDVVGVPSATLRMFTGPGLQFDIDDQEDVHDLDEMAVEVIDGGDGLFDSADTLVFYGEALDRLEPAGSGQLQRLYHRYATHNIYWLTWGGENGLRVDSLHSPPDGSPAWGDSIRFDLWQEHEYIWLPRREMSTGWVWSMLFENVPGYFYFSTPSQDAPGGISVALLSPDGVPHRTVLQLNGEQLADTTWTGTAPVELSWDGIQFEPSMNLLKITTRDDPGEVYIDYFHADYPRSLSFAAGRLLRPGGHPGRYTFTLGGAASASALVDVSDPSRPVRVRGNLEGDILFASLDVTGETALWLQASTGYRSPDSITSEQPGRIIGTGLQADVAIVVADELMEAARPLELIYENRGLTAILVSAGEVYDEFGQGLRDPGAIRSFFRYTQDSWTRPARSLLLVGDGTYDPMMHITSRKTLIPVYLALGYSAASGDHGLNRDDFYVTAHNENYLPEAPVSRIPALTAIELTAYLAKLMVYDFDSPPGQWANRILLAADDEWGNSTNESDHTLACEMLADSILPRSLNREKFYLIEYPWPPGTTPDGDHPQKPEAREDFVSELSAGYANVIFFGHGSYDQIAHEKLLVTSDLQRIENDCRLPVFIFASCDVGHFDMISANTMGEEFAMSPGSGAIVTIAATRGTYSGLNTYLYGYYYSRMFGWLRPDVGTSLWLAKLQNPGGIGSNGFNVVLGDGGLIPVFPPSLGCDLTVEGDTLHRGQLNSMLLEFPASEAAFPRVTESGSVRTYDCIGGTSFDYLHYGAPIYEGFISAGGEFPVDFFVPLQADTGSYARCSGTGITSLETEAAYREWVDLTDDGQHVLDTLPPEVECWIDGHRGESLPTVSGDALLMAFASDSSGISALGGGAGRSILMSLDGQGFDLSRYFSYVPDSYTRGELEYSLPDISEGTHRVILAVWDGMGNQARDTLDFISVDVPFEPLSSVLVYPNPGDGLRCFSFQAGAPGTVTVKVFTVAGRAIWETSATCSQGYGQVLWEGLDMDGDRPATGPYIFTVRFAGADGLSGEHTDVLAVVRED